MDFYYRFYLSIHNPLLISYGLLLLILSLHTQPSTHIVWTSTTDSISPYTTLYSYRMDFYYRFYLSIHNPLLISYGLLLVVLSLHTQPSTHIVWTSASGSISPYTTLYSYRMDFYYRFYLSIHNPLLISYGLLLQILSLHTQPSTHIVWTSASGSISPYTTLYSYRMDFC